MSDEFLSSQNASMAVGLMSGTSLDGIDAALIETDGVKYVRHISNYFLPYPKDLRSNIKEAIFLAKSIRNKNVKCPHIISLEKEITLLHAEATNNLLLFANLKPKNIDIVGFHGQTISHDPVNKFTWQIGDGAQLAILIGIEVVNKFRDRDVKFGGQGAPLVPLYHLALFNTKEIKRPVVILNIGGVSNLTYIGQGIGNLIGFDTGPGNALIDDWVMKHFNKPYDESGIIAASGKVDTKLLAELMENAFFQRTPPKALDRDSFDINCFSHLTPKDGAATLTEFTVEAIKASALHLPELPMKWFVTGGGRHNSYLMQCLKNTLGAEVININDIGFDGDILEAEAFAYLAVRAKKNLPLTFPELTGVDKPRSGGQINRVS
ncbi:MAG: anhydro-N-acetylmuramic acid kinase [Sphingomonadales bacterium]